MKLLTLVLAFFCLAGCASAQSAPGPGLTLIGTVPAVSCAGAPAAAQAAGFCTNTLNSTVFNTSTVDQSLTKALGFTWYYYDWNQTAQPSNTTLNGSSVAVGESSGGFQATLASATSLGTGPKFRGTAYGGGGYFEATASFTAVSDPGSGTWQAPFWSSALEPLAQYGAWQWPGQANPYYHYFEGDVMEYFQGSFSNLLTQYSGTSHDWWGTTPSANNVQDQHTVTLTQASYSSPHRYGMLWVPATPTTQGKVSYYYDGTLEGSTVYSQLLNQLETASQSFTTSQPAITMANPNPGNITAGSTVIDTSVAGSPTLGTVQSYVNAGGVGWVDSTSANINGVATKTATVPAGGVAAGVTVEISLNEDSGISASLPTFADDASNTYTRDVTCNHGNFENRVAIFHSILASPLTAGQHWTYTAGSGTPFGNFFVKTSAGVTGVDGTPACTNYPSGGAGPFASGSAGGAANDLYAGFVAEKSGGTAFTQSAGFSTPVCTTNYGATLCGALLETGAVAHNYAPINSTQSASVSSALVAFTSSGATGTPTLTLAANPLHASQGASDILQFVNTPPAVAPWNYAIVDNDHLVLIMGCTNANPCTVSSVQVWQANTASNVSN